MAARWGRIIAMTLTIQLEGPKLAALQDEAASLGVSVEQLADAILQRHVSTRNRGETVADGDAFRKAMLGTLSENAELYRRLAR
jgi:hypothetical protein